MFRPTTTSLRPIARNLVARRTFATTPKPQDVAKITLMGRMGADPEFLTTANGINMVKYSLGTSFGMGENRRTSWYKVACFDDRGRSVLESLGKGSLIYIEGDIELKVYEGEDGKRQTFVNVTQRAISPVFRKPIGGDVPAEGVEGTEGTDAEALAQQ